MNERINEWMSMESWWNNIGRGKLKYSEKKVAWKATWFNTEATWDGPGSKPGHHGEKPVNNSLGHNPVADKHGYGRNIKTYAVPTF